MKTKISSCLLLFLVLFAPWISTLDAQTGSTGAISGTLSDPSGGVIPRATVTLTSDDNGQERTTVTGAIGQYQFVLLPPATYRLKFSAEGFKSLEITTKINVTEAAVIDRRLEVGGEATQLTVEANVETIQTTSSSLGTVVSAETATAIPLTTRNYTNLLGLSAGVNGNVNNASGLGMGGVDYSVNGANPNQNNYMMDGVSITPLASGSVVGGFYAGMPIPNPDTLEEFKIQTSLYDAGYGRNPGANVNVVTKSGTNALHGTAFEFFRNTALNATDFFRQETCAITPSICVGTGVKQILNQNQFGGQLGGPIKKDKLFVFAAYQQTWQKNGEDPTGYQSGVNLIPIPAGDRGTTSLSGVDDSAAAAFRRQSGAFYCPANNPIGGPTFAGGTQVACDGSNISPYAMRYLQTKKADGSYYILGSGLTPSQTDPGVLQGVAFSIPAHDHQYQGMLNLDYIINPKQTLSSRYFNSYELQDVPFNDNLPGVPGHNDFGYQDEVLKLTSVLSNTLVNEVRGDIIRSVTTASENVPPSMYADTIWPTCGSIPANSPASCVPAGHGLLGGTTPMPPELNMGFGGSFFSGFGVNDNAQHQTTVGFGDQLSWTKGKHTMRFGGEFEDIRWIWASNCCSHGMLGFATPSDFLIGLPGACGSAVAPGVDPTRPLGCNGSGLSNIAYTSFFSVRSGPGGVVHDYRMKNADWFIQDDYKVSSRLTLNLGLRWEYDGQLSDRHGNLTNLWPSQMLTVPVPATNQTPTPGVNFVPAGGTYAGWVVPSNYDTKTWGPLPPGIISSGHTIATQNEVPKDNFAPRLGFAWQPTSSNRLVVRGGGGFFYDRVTGNTIVRAVELAPPYAETLDQGLSTNQFSSLAAPYESTPLGTFPIRWVNFATNQGSDITEAAEAQKMLTPVIYSWNLDLEYEMAPKLVLDVGYVGSHGIHLARGLNVISGAEIATPSHSVNGVTTNVDASGNTNARLRVPYLGLSPTGGQFADTAGSEKFNSLQITLRKQASHGLTFQAAYTWSRAFTNVVANGPISGDPLDLHQMYGPSTQYRPQRLVISYGWDIPYGNLKGFAGTVLGGWNLSGVTTIQDGQPLIIDDSAGGAIYGLAGASGLVLSRAQMAPGMTNADIATPGSDGQRLGGIFGGPGWFNKAAFTTISSADPRCGATVCSGWGNSSIGAILGPGEFNFDMALSKSIKVGGIHENAQLQFRAEAFNAFNHPQFGNPTQGPGNSSPVANDIEQSNFGTITSLSVNPRLMQLALKYIF